MGTGALGTSGQVDCWPVGSLASGGLWSGGWRKERREDTTDSACLCGVLACCLRAQYAGEASQEEQAGGDPAGLPAVMVLAAGAAMAWRSTWRWRCPGSQHRPHPSPETKLPNRAVARHRHTWRAAPGLFSGLSLLWAAGVRHGTWLQWNCRPDLFSLVVYKLRDDS